MKTFASLLVVAAAVQATAIVPREALLARDDTSPDFASIAAQPQPSVTGPTTGASYQTNTVAASAATSSGSAAATATSNSKRTFCWYWAGQWWGDCPKSTSAKATPTPTSAKSTSKCTTTLKSTAAATTAAATTSVYTKPAYCSSTTAYTPYYPATSTIKPQSATGTQTSGAACPTQPEAGTYCGFINPEDPCAPQPDGYGPVSTPDTPDAFANNPEWTKDALGAVTPKGFTQSFKNLNGSVSAAHYLGLLTYKTYDVQSCANACSCTEGCSAFNFFIERDPSQNPTNNDNNAPTVWGTNCPNPASMTSFKCTLWGGPITAADATNYGQYREQFDVLIAGSNGYDATPDNGDCTPKPQPGWGGGHHCGGGGIDGGKHHCGGHFFPGPFDVRICASFAVAQTQKNKDACAQGGSYDAVNFWNAYSLKKNGHFYGMYCALFTDKPDNADGSYIGGFSAGANWTVDWSWSQQHDSNSWDYGIKN